ncbi:hypothetical protein K3725_15480 [Leisingera sp. S132]|uniref:calcium-binding protein n=1 Tax=Leisingera sp. S132 TaxID=2867016 RepID=UPI0021A322B7|nr:calcium-binding protein [Leisingera sp. S132]UWQ78695.1 hypothetical protein K3725_15480 [Leisingera sp. S132]
MPVYSIIDQNDAATDIVTITSSMFGANLVTHYDTEFVDHSDSHKVDVQSLGVSTLRFPGGAVTETHFDINKPNSAVSKIDSSVALTPMDEFFGAAGAIGADVSIVIPTQGGFETNALQALQSGTFGSRNQLDSDYVNDVLSYIDAALKNAEDNGVIVTAFELGNEFWGSGQMTAAEYGRLVGQLSVLVHKKLDAAGNDADILVQTTASAGIFSPNETSSIYVDVSGNVPSFYRQSYIDEEYDGVIPISFQTYTIDGQGRDWEQAADIAVGINAADGAPEAITGALLHYYANEGLAGVDAGKSNVFRRVNAFEELLDRSEDLPELTQHLTEWNPQEGTHDTKGLKHASMLVEMVYEMATHGVEAAQIWPLTFNQTQERALLNHHGDGLSISGEAFKMMSESLVGLQAKFDFEVLGKIDVHGYGDPEDDNSLVLFVSERSGEFSENVTLDVGRYIPNTSYFIVKTELWDGGAGGEDSNAVPVLNYSDGAVTTGGLVELDLNAWANTRIEISYITERADIIVGRGGNDSIIGAGGNDLLEGNAGSDTLYGGAGDDEIMGGSGNDEIDGGANYDTIDAGEGNDSVWGGNGRDLVLLGDGSDVFHDNGQNDQHGQDTVYGGAGHDVINGGGGHDLLCGNEGNDSISGGIGNDQIHGGKNYDTIDAGEGNDSVWGGNGRDLVLLGDGNDVFHDNGQNDQHGQDTVYGGAGDDLINGSGGNDTFNGGSGKDIVSGGAGNDVFEFKTGDLVDWDELSGTVTERSTQLDLVRDFVVGEDKIEFDGFSGVENRSDLKAWKTVIDNNDYFTVCVRSTNERILFDVEDDVTWQDFFQDSNFLFF